MRRFLSLLLAVLMVLSTCMVGAVSVTATSGEASSGTSSAGTDYANKTYEPLQHPETAEAISTGAEFVEKITANPSGVYYLANDLVGDNKVTATVATFTGQLYGNGKVIQTTVPLFGTIDGSSLTKDAPSLNDNVSVCDLTIKGSIALTDNADTADVDEAANAGALARTATDARVHRVSNEANVSGSTSVGGIVGAVTVATASTETSPAPAVLFIACVNKGAITASSGNAGGILGMAAINGDNVVASLTVQDCVNEGNVSVTTGENGYAGGILGNATVANLSITDCVVEGDITGASNVAGIVAYVTSSGSVLVDGCVITGAITTDDAGNNYAGGVAGYIYANPGTTTITISDNVVSGIVSQFSAGSSAGGGFVGRIDGASGVTVTKIEFSRNTYCAEELYVKRNAGGVVGIIYSDFSVSEILFSSNVIITDINAWYYVGGIIGDIGECPANTKYENNFLMGSVTKNSGGEGPGPRSYIGAFAAGYFRNANPYITNNAAYMDVLSSQAPACLSPAGYHNYAIGHFNNNVYVGTVSRTNGAEVPVSLAHCRNDKGAWSDVSGNYYYRTNGSTNGIIDGSITYMSTSLDNSKNVLLTPAHATKMDSPVSNVAAGLNANNENTEVWTYIAADAPVVINGQTVSEKNIPVSALTTLTAASAALSGSASSTVKTISTPAEFYEMQPDGNYKLGANLELSYSYGLPFTGTLDGAGYTITLTGAPVFWYAANATIKNVKLSNAVINNNKTFVGALALEANNITVEDVSSDADVTAYNCSGGLIGRVTGSASFTDCVVTADLTVTDVGRAGGIVVVVESDSADNDVTFDNCSYAGTLTGKGITGGIAGQLSGTFGDVTVTDCTVSGSINSTKAASGIIGSTNGSYKLQVTNCKIGSNVSSNTVAGGVVANVSFDDTEGSSVTLTSCIVTGSVFGNGATGGMIGTVTSPDTAIVRELNILSCAYLGDTLRSNGSLGGLVGGGDSEPNSPKYTVDSCVVATSIEGKGAIGGLFGALHKHHILVNATNCLVFGSIKNTEGNASGLFGYGDGTGDDNYYFQNNAIYADITCPGTAAVGTSYYNSGQGTFMNNVYVGSMTVGDGKTVFANGKNTVKAISGNYYYRMDGGEFDYNYNKVTDMTGTTEMGYATEDLTGSDKLGSTDWTYESDILIKGERFTGNLPKGALATLRAAGAITAPVQLIADADGFTKMEADGYYKLTADIELSASYAETFTGVLDGDGHTITITGNAPVFASLEGAKIYNVMIKGSINDTTSASVGALAYTARDFTLDNVSADITINAECEGVAAGALFGIVYGGASIQNCTVSGSVTSVKFAGGIAGKMTDTTTFDVSGCLIGCDISGNSNTGGMIGHVIFTILKPTVSFTDCAVTGTLSGACTAGYIGALYDGDLATTYATLNVKNCAYLGDELRGTDQSGGVVGYSQIDCSTYTFDSCVIATNFVTSSNIGGMIGGYSEGGCYLTVQYCLVFGSINTTGTSKNRCGGLIGYGTGSNGSDGRTDGFRFLNNAIYVDITRMNGGVSAGAIGAYLSTHNARYQNNVYVGSISVKDDMITVFANNDNAGGTVSGNYYFRTDGLPFDLLIKGQPDMSVGATAMGSALSNLTDGKSDDLSTDATELDSTVWTYVENLALPGKAETFTGNIPLSALAALDVETTTYGSFPLEVNSVDAFLNMLPGGYYKLTADIVLPEDASYALPFYGKLDGNGHKITVNGAPAFSYVSAGAIQNLTVDGELDNTNANAGAIAPEASFISLENVTVDVFVSATENAGGFVGVVYGVGSFVGCTNKGIVSASTNAGGIVGLALGNTTLRGCTNEGAVSANTNAGGFVGSASAAVAFDACANKASVSASNGNAGGIVGLIHENCTFHSCTNEGAVSASTNAGGILGSATSTVVKLDSCKSTGTVVATTNAGGIVGTIIGDKTNKPISSIEINDCVATGTVAATNYAGGIIARALNMVEGYSFNITNCAYFGAGVSAGCAGGIISNLNSDGPKADTSQWIGLHGCVVVTNVSSTDEAGGLIGSINYGDGTRSTINGCFFKGKISTTKNTNSVGGLIGYLAGTAAMKSKYEDNVVYATIQKAGAATHGAIVGYANCRSKTFDFYRNIFVGTIYSTNHTFAVTHNYTSIANGGAANSQYLGKSENNFWYSDDANLEFNSFANNKDSTNPTAYTDAMLQKMSSAAQNLITESGFSADLWAYETEYSIMGESYTGNIPAAALATMKALMPSGSTVGEIYEAADLLGMDPNGSYKLMNNITLDTSYTLPFNGTLDGSGYTITVNGAPVFSSINAATVKDLTIKVEGALSATVDYAGALAAEANFASLSNVTVDGNAISAEKAAGGLIGIVKVTGEFVNCTSNVSVSSADAAGGIVGSFSGNGAFANCTNNAVVSGTGIAGGIVGSSSGNCVFNSCSNKGAITSSAKMAGGVVGASLSGYTSFTGCSNEGSVNGYSFAGGIVSVVAVNTNFVNCSNKGAVTATGNVEQFNGFAGGITAYVGSTVTEDGAIQDVASDGDRKNVCDPREYTVFDHCSNTGDVSGMRYVGGILGTTFDSASFEYCSNDGKISGSNDARLYTGGIAGAVFVEGDFYRCDNSGDVYGNAMTGGIAGASGLSNYVGPFGGQRFVGCTHTGLVSVTSVEGISNDVARVPGGIVGYARSDVPYRSIVISYCAITGDVELHMVEGYKANSASVLAGTVADLTHAVFEYNYFTGKISADKSGVVLYLPYDNNSAVAEENVKGNYSVYQSGLYFGLDSSGLTELPEDYIIKTKDANGNINYTWLLEILNENFEGEAFVLLNGIAVLNDEYNVVGNIPETPEEITTAEEFLAMDPYGNYKLMADITLDKSYEYIFAGILDGNGHTITITAPIFEAVEDATIYSLTIDGSIETEAQNIGALANFADGITLNGVTNNTDILNKISVTSDNDYSKATGGLVGKAVGTITLTRCRNNGKITAAMPGGLVGFAAKATFTATDCVNAGVLTNYSTKVASAGGILAYGELGSYEFTDCYNTGDLLFASATGYGVLAGGIVGSIRGNANTIALDGCANGGKIVANGYVGGLVGLAIGLTESEFTDCKNAGMIISSGDFAGGIAAWVSNSTTTKAGNKVSEVPCNTSVTHYFTNCTNIGDVTADGRQASGILTHTADFATFKYCLNTGDIRTRTGNTDYSHAAGITSWSGGETKILYCVNTGDITGAANAAGIGGYLGHRSDAFEYHTITGCVTTGNIVSEYPSACGRSDAVGIVRMTASDGYYINGCVVDGTIKSLGGNAYGLFHYANVSANNVSGNVILLEPGDISAAQHTYLVADVAGSITPSNRVDSLYIRPGVFTDMFSGVKDDETRYPMPESYGYLFTDEDLTDGDLLTWMNAYELEDFVAKKSFVMNDGMPMHKEVDDVYNLRNLTFDDIIPSAALPEVEPDTEPDEDESTTPEDSDSSEPESSEVVDPDTSDSEPESSEVVDPGTSDSEPDDDNTTEPKDNDTTKEPADESTTGGDADTDKPDDDKKKGCGSVVSATLALAAIALIAPAMVVIKKKDEE